jgi:uncharacterized Tic20 family protein
MKKMTDEQWVMLQHGVGLFCFILPLFGNLIATYLVWQQRRDEKLLFYEHGLEVVNFQLSMTIYFCIATLLLLVWVGIFMLIALCVFQLLVVGLAVLRAHDLEVYEYPLNLRLISHKK